LGVLNAFAVRRFIIVSPPSTHAKTRAACFYLGARCWALRKVPPSTRRRCPFSSTVLGSDRRVGSHVRERPRRLDRARPHARGRHGGIKRGRHGSRGCRSSRPNSGRGRRLHVTPRRRRVVGRLTTWGRRQAEPAHGDHEAPRLTPPRAARAHARGAARLAPLVGPTQH
jgi:hypothetical protein